MDRGSQIKLPGAIRSLKPGWGRTSNHTKHSFTLKETKTGWQENRVYPKTNFSLEIASLWEPGPFRPPQWPSLFGLQQYHQVPVTPLRGFINLQYPITGTQQDLQAGISLLMPRGIVFWEGKGDIHILRTAVTRGPSNRHLLQLLLVSLLHHCSREREEKQIKRATRGK